MKRRHAFWPSILLEKNYPSFGTAIAYGIGHGGVEALFVYVLAQVNNVVISLEINQHNQNVISGLSKSVMNVFLHGPSQEFFMSVIEGIPVFFLQICLSLMVWYAVNRKGKTWMFPLAILTHALINIPAGLMQSGLTHSLAIVYIPLFLTVLLAAVFLILAYQFGAYFQERKTKKEAYQNLLLYAHELEGLNDDLSAFKHDYINILMTLDESFRDKDFDQAEHIFYDTVYPTKELIQGQRSNIQKYAKIRIQELRNLLISKEIHAKEKGVLFHVEIIGIIEETQVSMIDLIRAISILIDNAVEATMQVDDCDTIEISLVHVDGDFSFACKNSILGLEFDRNRLFEKNYSTKNELLPNHGIGLYSLNKILDKNPFMALKTKVIGSDIIQTLYIKGETPNQLKEVLS